jgi:hypothetical protein
MERNDLLQCSQELDTGSYPEAIQFHLFTTKCNTIYQGLPRRYVALTLSLSLSHTHTHTHTHTESPLKFQRKSFAFTKSVLNLEHKMYYENIFCAGVTILA